MSLLPVALNFATLRSAMARGFAVATPVLVALASDGSMSWKDWTAYVVCVVTTTWAVLLPSTPTNKTPDQTTN